MRPGAGELLAWRPHRLDALGQDLLAGRRHLLAVEDDLTAGGLPAAWQGDAAAAARADHRLLTGELHDLVAEVSAVARAVDVAAEAADSARQLLERTLADATREGFSVDRSTALVTDSLDWSLTHAHQQADRERRRAELAAHVEQALAAAAHTDAELAAALDRVTRSLVDGGGASLPAAAASGGLAGRRELRPPPAGGPAGALFAWWRTLTDSEQQRVLVRHPDWVGNGDGIPGWARHLANLSRIAPLRAMLRRRHDRDPDVAERKLAGLDAIERLLAAHPDRQLLSLDATGSHGLRAVVAVGDVDTAEHVTVHTPGLGSNVRDGLAGYDAQLDDLRRTAEELSGDETATVLFLGMDTPQVNLSLLDVSDTSVVNDNLARAGADDLAAFLNGLDASRGEDPHLTAQGHSYGSLTTGLALHHSTGVDDAVHLGSPGLGTDDLSVLDVPSGHHHQLEADWDPVADLGAFGDDPSTLEGMHHLATDAHDPGPDGAGELDGIAGHTSYLADGSTSQHNLAAVVTDERDDLIARTEGPDLADRARAGLRRLQDLLGPG